MNDLQNENEIFGFLSRGDGPAPIRRGVAFSSRDDALVPEIRFRSPGGVCRI
jgi:hypothetical protein